MSSLKAPHIAMKWTEKTQQWHVRDISDLKPAPISAGVQGWVAFPLDKRKVWNEYGQVFRGGLFGQVSFGRANRSYRFYNKGGEFVK